MHKTTKPTASERAISGLDYARLAALGSANAEALMKVGEAMLNGVATFNEELASFATTRLKAQIENGRAITQCGNWGEAMEQQMTAARAATEQYLAEAGRLANLAAEMTLASYTPWQRYLQTAGGATKSGEHRAAAEASS